ncbi:hypothetical protein R3P38DRAFT_1116727 [Favolaschia claudopus]|uniref:Uncharacterized protein n=1 Tax=Favolaschia claudopus TaxID=2862362 RepID=A0AAW0B834_9AGAR
MVKSEPRSPANSPSSPSSFVHSSGVAATLSVSSPRARMAPMSPTYDRLEAGRPPVKQAKRFGWKKFAIGAGLLLVLVWLFVPKEKRSISSWTSPTWEPGNTPYEGKPRPSQDDIQKRRETLPKKRREMPLIPWPMVPLFQMGDHALSEH